MNIKDQVYEILIKNMDSKKHNISDEDFLYEDLHLSSYKMLIVLDDIQHNVSIKIDFSKMNNVKSVAQLVHMVEQSIKGE